MTDTLTYEYRITIEHDPDSSPADWGEPFTLVMPEQWHNRIVGRANVVDVLQCAECGGYPSEHPTAHYGTEHEWQTARMTGTRTCRKCNLLPVHVEDADEPCDSDEWVADENVAAFVLVDSRGPYTTIHQIDESDLDQYEPGPWGRREVWVCGLVNNPPVLNGWDMTDEQRERIIGQVVEQWRQYFQGEVFWWTVERRQTGECDHGNEYPWEECESLGGVYGSDYLRDSIKEYAGLSDDDIDGATVNGELEVYL